MATVDMVDLLLAVIGQGIINLMLVVDITVTRNRLDDLEQKLKRPNRKAGDGIV